MCVCVCVRERERETETETDRETERLYAIFIKRFLTFHFVFVVTLLDVWCRFNEVNTVCYANR